MATVHAFLSILRRAISQAQRENIAARGIEFEAHPPRDVGGIMRVGLHVWGPRDQLLLLRDWLIQEQFEPIVCLAFTDRGGLWQRMRGVSTNRSAWNAVAPAWPKTTGDLEFPQPNDPFRPPVWFAGWPMPDETREEPEQ